MPLRYDTNGPVATISMDDGKANALSPAMIEALHEALDRAQTDDAAVVIAGREGRFSGGFDLRIMMSGPDAARDLLTQGAELFLRLYEFPRPVVMACTGHAIAGGVLLLATGDHRIGARGDFNLGLNEVAIGMPVPILAHRLAFDRLERQAFVPAVLHAKLYDPESAVRAGWLDAVADPSSVLDEAVAVAARLAELSPSAYALTKSSIRRESIEHIRNTLDRDFERLTGGA